MQISPDGPGRVDEPSPADPKQRTSIRWAIRYRLPSLFIAVGIVFLSTAIHYLVLVRGITKQSLEISDQDREIREKLIREAQRNPEDPAAGLIGLFMMSGRNPKLDELARDRSHFEQRMFQSFGIGIAMGGLGLPWLLLVMFPLRHPERSSSITIALTAFAFIFALIGYALFLWHLSTSMVDLESAFPFFAGALLPLLFIQPAAVWIGCVERGVAWALLLIAALGELSATALLFGNTEEPLSVILGQTHSDLREDWYLAVALAEWVVSVLVFSLGWWFGKRSKLTSSLR